MNTVKHLIRRFCIWLEDLTEHWIISTDDWRVIDRADKDPEAAKQAKRIIENARREWPNDPHISYAGAIVDRFTLLGEDQ